MFLFSFKLFLSNSNGLPEEHQKIYFRANSQQGMMQLFIVADSNKGAFSSEIRKYLKFATVLMLLPIAGQLHATETAQDKLRKA